MLATLAGRGCFCVGVRTHMAYPTHIASIPWMYGTGKVEDCGRWSVFVSMGRKLSAKDLDSVSQRRRLKDIYL